MSELLNSSAINILVDSGSTDLKWNSHSAQWLTSAEAVERLGVVPETLYAYVSRGLIKTTGARGSNRRYLRRDIEALASKGRRSKRSRPADTPVESQISLIQNGVLYYRGRCASTLAGMLRFEEFTDWLWHGTPSRGADATAELDRDALAGLRLLPAPADALPLDRLRMALPVLAAHRQDEPGDVVAAGWWLLRHSAAVMRPDPGPATSGLVAGVLSGLTGDPAPGPAAQRLLTEAMILVADNGLTTQTMTVRMSASVGADLFGAVQAGLALARGTRPGTTSLAVEDALRRRAGGSATGDLAGMQSHEHYPSGDPRAAYLVGRLAELGVGNPRMAVVRDHLAEGAARGGEPNIDFAFAALAFLLGAPRGSAEYLFAIARMVGWIAHYLEECELVRRDGVRRYRFPALYTGSLPKTRAGARPDNRRTFTQG
ncbi:citrate synthase [Actinoplanes ianthinogenes]|uniref:citrate synthase (unknown stereospecificity) n=1 Tax=Actinoplanes ianthinogenes TaxID=122358 RepID=A0ABM7M3M0_9ACTN|nr:citrate synthase [Actinoplanes ianthinogenes]GGR26728.1 citrate synthase [Actinoplanes ianthinogenes]